MQIPGYIQKKLDKREKLANELIKVCMQVDDWLVKQGADLQDEAVCDAVQTGCMIYCEPATAKKTLEDYIGSL